MCEAQQTDVSLPLSSRIKAVQGPGSPMQLWLKVVVRVRECVGVGTNVSVGVVCVCVGVCVCVWV